MKGCHRNLNSINMSDPHLTNGHHQGAEIQTSELICSKIEPPTVKPRMPLKKRGSRNSFTNGRSRENMIEGVMKRPISIGPVFLRCLHFLTPLPYEALKTNDLTMHNFIVFYSITSTTNSPLSGMGSTTRGSPAPRWLQGLLHRTS